MEMPEAGAWLESPERERIARALECEERPLDQAWNAVEVLKKR